MSKSGDKFAGLITMGGHVPEADLVDFATIRGTAIQEHSILENALCQLMAVFGKLSIRTAGILFFKLTTAAMRDQALEELLTRNHGTDYLPFWDSFSGKLGKLTTTRNKIVHGVAIRRRLNSGKDVVELAHGGFIAEFPSLSTPLTRDDVLRFTDKCKFLTHVCWQFLIFLNPRETATWTQDKRQSWHEIFRLPLAGPYPDTHPLSLNYREPGTPPPPSPGSPESNPGQG